MGIRPGFALLCCLLGGFAACAGANHRAVQRIKMAPVLVRADATAPEATPAEQTLFEGANEQLRLKHFRKAADQYQRLLDAYPAGAMRELALYNLGLSLEKLGEFSAATDVFVELIELSTNSRTVIDAGFHLGACHAEGGAWAASAETFRLLLERDDLSSAERLEALTRRGLAQFRLGDDDAAKLTLHKTLRVNRQLGDVERLASDFFVGMAQYYLAALVHKRFRLVEVSADDAMAEQLDEKARLLLLAERKYIKTIRTRNSYWATAAGFQIGSLYKEFYTTMIATLPDFTEQASANAQKANVAEDEAQQLLEQVYQQEVHKKIKILLTKALRVFEKSLLVGEQVGLRTDWVAKSRYQVEQLKQLLLMPPDEAIERIPQLLPEEQPGKPAENNSLEPPERPHLLPIG